MEGSVNDSYSTSGPGVLVSGLRSPSTVQNRKSTANKVFVKGVPPLYQNCYFQITSEFGVSIEMDLKFYLSAIRELKQ